MGPGIVLQDRPAQRFSADIDGKHRGHHARHRDRPDGACAGSARAQQFSERVDDVGVPLRGVGFGEAGQPASAARSRGRSGR